MTGVNYLLKKGGVCTGLLFLLVWLGASSCGLSPDARLKSDTEERSAYTPEVRDYYLQVLDSLSFYTHKMDTAMGLRANKAAFAQARKWYKYAEPFLIAFDYTNYLTLNGPNLPIIHAEDYTEVKKLKPRSFQVVEELLYAEEGYDAYDLYLQLTFLQSRIPFIAHNHILESQRDRHYLKMIRDAIVTVATKGLTGFDSPARLYSLEESAYVYEAIEDILQIFEKRFESETLIREWRAELKTTKASLRAGTFDAFDRYHFIKNHTNRQLQLVAKTARDWDIRLSPHRALNPLAENLFDSAFFNITQFTPKGTPPITQARVALGKALFHDASLSQKGQMSCATCHVAVQAFTDGKATAVGNDGTPLLRNTPTLPYTVYQRKFFWDATASSLESQIFSVVNNTKEFHTDMRHLEKKVSESAVYQAQFDSLYGGKTDGRTIRNAISTYIRSLAPFDTKFDRNMQGKEATLSAQEVKGFNLFMGKAACATCHFPPTFSGTVPPTYAESELEKLGVPANASFQNPVADTDPGAYYPYEVEERRGFFKTPTVRNVGLTAPYMHNGVYETLEEVMNFYNLGGGEGMGLETPYQTLPADLLFLTDEEQSAIIAFMKALSDAKYSH